MSTEQLNPVLLTTTFEMKKKLACSYLVSHADVFRGTCISPPLKTPVWEASAYHECQTVLFSNCAYELFHPG